MTDTGRAIRRIVLIAFLTAILETAKFALNAIANVELITLLIIIFTRRFGVRMMLAVCMIFTVLECLWWHQHLDGHLLLCLADPGAARVRVPEDDRRFVMG
ncbi:MAG: hypothetical protein IIY72_02015, partial [Solobacterium sp.]|nr:hypothetical protein [Solobacterium sp.]